jgi:imidazolonepropionase-like amidohydrolase
MIAALLLAMMVVEPQPIVISHVNVITMDLKSTVITDASVEIAGGKVVRIMPNGGPASHTAKVIDGRGRWLMPGLIDSHVHYDEEVELTSYLRKGVTTVISLGDPPEQIARMPQSLAKLNSGELAGPRLYAAGLIISNGIKLSTAAETRAFVRAEKAAGRRLIKVYNGTSREVFDAAVDEAHKLKMAVFGHMPRALEPQYVVSSGLDVLAHAEELFFTTLKGSDDADLETLTPDWKPDLTTLDPVLESMSSHKVFLIPNLVASYHFVEQWVDPDPIFTSSEAALLTQDTLEGWRDHNYAHRTQVEKRMLREGLKRPLLDLITWKAHQHGVVLLAGTDAPIPTDWPGESLHEELRLLVAAGLTREEALAAATRNAGDLIKTRLDPSVCLGIVREGCEADLVLLSKDPRADIRNTETIEAIVAKGRWFTPADLIARQRAMLKQ